ncbi:hypothetical protein [Halosolutus gelatinilyticus]|uniref:hypothetical protein n=1 Tax=Halosolutus gelatinilyticus TaxID=2931975 RepID=UPI001FF2305C|nr:hypothetical protein [Halosolutus gelatinilyticus]
MAAAGLSAVGTTAAAGDYTTVVNIVDDCGADNTGTEPINDALNEAVADDTKVVFPDGTYWIAGDGFTRWRFGEGDEGRELSNVALVGRGDVTLRPTADTNPYIITLWGDAIRIENFRVDQTAHHTSTGISAVAADELVLRDLTFVGAGDGPGGPTDDYGDGGERTGPFNLIPGISDPDGSGLIRNVHSPDGTVPYYRKGGCWVNFLLHRGHLQIERCSFENFSDNAIYASGPGRPSGGGGSVGVENCFFRNNNVSSIRLGTAGSYAKNCTVVFDGEGPPPLPWGGLTGRTAWLWYEFDGYLENIDVVSDHEAGHGVYDRNGTAYEQPNSIDLQNCRFELNADGTDAVRVLSGGDAVTARNVSVTGDAGDGAALTIQDRELDVDNLCVHQSGADRDGLDLAGVTGSITNAAIDVTGEQIVTDEESDVTVRNLREKGGCPPAQRQHSAEQ